MNANLVNANLGNANLGSADLVNADLVNADLVNAILGFADLGNANLVNANLVQVDLRNANLGHADLRNANLGDANLGHAYLGNANLEGASLFATHFHAVDLREVKGLDKVEHQGPSPVSSQTLKKSEGQVPEVFLKGCGLEDWEILSARLHDPNLRADEVIDIAYEVANLRTKSPIIPRSVFISYSNKDIEFIEKLESYFDKDGIRSWRDVRDMVVGPIEQQIDRAIKLQEVVLLVISENSIDSDWVQWEVKKARKLEQKLRKDSGEQVNVLCPVALDKEWWKDSNPWPARLRAVLEEYHILDLSEWKDDSKFEGQYERLKKGLGIYYANEGEEES